MFSKSMYHLAATGDVFVNTRSGMSAPFGPGIQSVFDRAEQVMINLETVLSSSGEPRRKAIVFRAVPQQAAYLRTAGVTIANIANNHTFDYGVTGLRDTIKHLREAGIKIVGAVKTGNSQDPCLVKLSCGNLAILGYAQTGERESGLGVARLHASQIISDIARAKAKGADWSL